MNRYLQIVAPSLCLIALIGFCVRAYIRSQSSRRAHGCGENLVKIDGAKQQWALENLKNPNEPNQPGPTFDDLVGPVGTGYLKEMPVCPDGGRYIIGSIGEDPICTLGGSLVNFRHSD